MNTWVGCRRQREICKSYLLPPRIADSLLPRSIDYYGVTFDYLVPIDELDPDVLQINIIELETTSGPFANGEAYARDHLLFAVELAEYAGKKVLAVPRCCQKRKGTQDRLRVNSSVAGRGPFGSPG